MRNAFWKGDCNCEMLEHIFLQILNMSFMSSIVILFILPARFFLKKAPKIFSYTLWSVVLFRLLCPFSFESMLSFIPVQPQPIPKDIVQQEVPQINTGILLLDRNVNSVLSGYTVPEENASPLQILVTLGVIFWLIGIAVLLSYSLYSLFRLRIRLVGAVRLFDNIYLSDTAVSPFVAGFFRPKIYLPSAITEKELHYVLLHEKTHIRRLDHIVKPVAFCTAVLHWFNPLVWAAFVLACKDMEMSCDESVLRKMGTDIRQEYSASLLHLAVGGRMAALAPLSFGEGDIKARIKNVLYYNKPAFRSGAAALLIVAVLCTGLMVNPKGASPKSTVVFPAYSDGKNDYNAALYETKPFTLQIDLPDGWEVRLPAEEERINSPGCFTPVYLYDGEVRKAVVGFNTFSLSDESEMTKSDFYKAVYSDIFLGSLNYWADYNPVVSSENSETAFSTIYTKREEKGKSAADWSVMSVSGILSYQKEMGIYVSIRFEENAVTEKQREQIAKSICLS